jgi:hypothetical protein
MINTLAKEVWQQISSDLWSLAFIFVKRYTRALHSKSCHHLRRWFQHLMRGLVNILTSLFLDLINSNYLHCYSQDHTHDVAIVKSVPHRSLMCHQSNSQSFQPSLALRPVDMLTPLSIPSLLETLSPTCSTFFYLCPFTAAAWTATLDPVP